MSDAIGSRAPSSAGRVWVSSLPATGLGRASLYGAFGDKEQIFARALERYCTRAGDAHSLARMLTVLLQGIAASARAGRSKAQLEAAIETALALVAPQPT